jgi:hypothetical protein
MDMIENKLDVRSCADIGNEFFVTLNQAAMEPRAVGVRDLLEQYQGLCGQCARPVGAPGERGISD